MGFGWRAEARSLQPLRMGNAAVTFIFSSPAHDHVHVGWKISRSGKAARSYSPIELEAVRVGGAAWRSAGIGRPLRVQTSIVAKDHDTSEQQIRKHYAASILDFTDEITRETLPSLGPALEPAASNVVKLTKR